jgi:hypothetical protein
MPTRSAVSESRRLLHEEELPSLRRTFRVMITDREYGVWRISLESNEKHVENQEIGRGRPLKRIKGRDKESAKYNGKYYILFPAI